MHSVAAVRRGRVQTDGVAQGRGQAQQPALRAAPARREGVPGPGQLRATGLLPFMTSVLSWRCGVWWCVRCDVDWCWDGQRTWA